MSDRLVVVIDDERKFETDFPVLYFRNSTTALGYLARMMLRQSAEYGQAIDELWLDHDLGQSGTNVDDVRPVVDFLNALAHTHLKIDIKKIFVHSQNPAGAESVVQLLKKHYDVVRVPLPELI